jgi:prepilin-type N-terminal cleavage/methylation domain-containing protein
MMKSNRNQQRGFTFVELLVSIGIFSLASAIIFPGIVYMARHQAATTGQQRVENNARRVMTEMISDALDATSIQITSSTAQFEHNLIIRKPNQVVIWRYRNGDGNNATIRDNVVARAEHPTAPVDYLPQLTWVSPVGAAGAFVMDPRTPSGTRPLVNVLLRVGDRSPVPGDALRDVDDLETGRGYQSFLMDFSISKGDRVQ